MQLARLETKHADMSDMDHPCSDSFAALPDAVQCYIAHTSGGLSLRQVAGITGRVPSTILRQVRRIEQRRDDTLFDEALDAVGSTVMSTLSPSEPGKEWTSMLNNAKTKEDIHDTEVEREARRILRRLCEKDAFLAVAGDMDKAVVIRESVPGRHTRTAVVARDIVQKFALNDWIECVSRSRISRYAISNTGRTALKRMLEEDRQTKARKSGDVSRITPFAAQHQDMSDRPVQRGEAGENPPRQSGGKPADDPRAQARPVGIALPDRRSGGSGRTPARRLRDCPDGPARDPELGQFPGPWRYLIQHRRNSDGPPRPHANAWPMRWGHWGPACLMWRFACAVSWKAWRRLKSGSAGRRGRVRSSCASPCSAWPCTTVSRRPPVPSRSVRKADRLAVGGGDDRTGNPRPSTTRRQPSLHPHP